MHFNEFWQMYMPEKPPPWSRCKSCFCRLQHFQSRPLAVHPSLTPCPTQLLICLLSLWMSWHFLELYTSGIIQYGLFHVWLLSLRITTLCFLFVVMCIINFSLLHSLNLCDLISAVYLITVEPENVCFWWMMVHCYIT